MTTKVKNPSCPDWRDREAYPRLADDLESWEWKWEFMRRSPEYRELYDGCRPVKSPHYRNLPIKGRAGPEGFAVQRKFGLHTYPNPNLAAKELDRNPYKTNYPEIIEGMAKNMWIGMMRLHDNPEGPTEAELWRKKRPGQDFSEYGVYEVLDFMEQVYYMPEITDEGKSDFHKIVTLAFDMNRPIGPQTEEAGRILAKVARHHKYSTRAWRNEQKFWPRYLRVIDAEEADESPKTIYLEIIASEMDKDSYDKKIGQVKNPSQAGKNLIVSARNIMNKISYYS